MNPNEENQAQVVEAVAVRMPKVGDIVMAALPNDSHHPGEERAAIVTAVWSNNCVNLMVIPDGSNDYSVIGLLWLTSATFSAEPRPYGWRWREQA